MCKVLVCVVGQLRATGSTWPTFQQNVLDVLDADLAVCTDLRATGDGPEPFLANAQHLFDASRSEPLHTLFDRVQEELILPATDRPDWRRSRSLPGNWLGGLWDIAGSGAIMMHQRWCLLRGLQQAGLLDRYDRFVFTRSDFYWAAPHPPTSVLSPECIWVPQGQDHDGLNDRHAVVAARDVPGFLNVLGPLLLRPEAAAEAFAGAADVNFEQYLGWCVRVAGLLPRIRRMPYTMFLVREPDGPTNWTTGSWDEDLKCYIKLRPECDAAFATHALFPTTESWLETANQTPHCDDIVPVAELCGLVRPWSLARRPLSTKTTPARADVVRTGIRVRVKTGRLELIDAGTCRELQADEWVRKSLGYVRPQGRDSQHMVFRDAFYITIPGGMLLWRRDGRVTVRRAGWLDGAPLIGRIWNLLIRLTHGSLFTFVADNSTTDEPGRS